MWWGWGHTVIFCVWEWLAAQLRLKTAVLNCSEQSCNMKIHSFLDYRLEEWAVLVGVPQDYFWLEKLVGWRFAGASCWPPLSLTVVCHIIKPGGDIRVSRPAHRNTQPGSAWAEWRLSGFLSAGISEDTWGILWHHVIAVMSRQMPLTEGKVINFLHSFPIHITSQLTSSLASCSLSRNQPDRDFKKRKYN